MDSIEKVHQLARDYSGPPNPDAEPLELMLRSAVAMVGPSFLAMLPDDANYLDAALEQMALQLLDLRSDGSRGVQLATADGTPLQLEAGT